MISDRTKQFIFNNLIKDLSNVEMIRHDESLWFIDREKKYWYLELVKTGKLYWRYQFFTEFFDMYSIDREVYEPIIREFVELVLNCNVTSTKTTMAVSSQMVSRVLKNNESPRLIAGSIPNTSMDLVLDNGITSTEVEFGVFRNEIVEDALNNGITSTSYHPFAEYEKIDSVLNTNIKSSRPANKSLTIVDSVLNEGVTSMGFTNRDKPFIVDSVLTNGITSTHEIVGLSNDIVDSVLTNGVTTKLRGGNATEQIKSVLKNGVKSTDCEFLSLESEVDSVLTNGITSTNSTKLLSHIRLDLILKEGVGNLIPLNAYRETMIKYVLKDKPTNE